MTKRHSWSIADDKAALKAYLKGLSKSEADKIAENRGIKTGSFWMRIGNFQYLATDGKKGYSHYARQSRQGWEDYKKSRKTYRKNIPTFSVLPPGISVSDKTA